MAMQVDQSALPSKWFVTSLRGHVIDEFIIRGSNCPWLACRGDTRAIVEGPIFHGDTVFLCRPKSPDLMARAILTIMADHELRTKLRRGRYKLRGNSFPGKRRRTE